ncbi:MAG: enoyl-[acyl-carrier-protein] reductase FabK [Eubacteriales bacterium]|nr:enoyl-[acyl-carrier-protein] reductase FabK [Eubacteriales bacterium]
MKTRVSTLLGTEYPVIQGGMAWVADHHLAAAVSMAGGLGLIGAANAPAEWVRTQIQEVKKHTDKPFGVNVMLMSPYADEVAKVIAEEKVPVVTTGAGNPEKYLSLWKNQNIKVIPVIASVALAKRMERCGVDAVVAEGCESGGHIGESTTMTLVPQVVDAVKLPVIAAGGIGDGRGMAAALMLGAEGVQMGTRFVATSECHVHKNYKERLLRAKDIDTRVTGRNTGHPVRTLRNEMTKKYLELEASGATLEELEYLTLGALRKAVVEGDMKSGSVMSGQIAGLISNIMTCQEVIDEVTGDAQKIIAEHASRFL